MKPEMKFNPPEASQKHWYNLAANKATKHLDIYLFGVVGGWRVNAQTFLDDLRGAGEVNTITVYLNTVGGSFYDGLPIYNMLKQHKAHVTVKVMGYALSMGSVIMLAGDQVEAAESSLIMIHRAHGGVWGHAEDMRKGADILISHEQVIIPEYSRRLGVSHEQVQSLLADETWYTAAQAKEAGLIDVLIADSEGDDSVNISDESLEYANQHFNNIPTALMRRSVQQNNNLEGDDVKPEDIQAIAEAVVNSLKAGQKSDDVESLRTENAALKEKIAELSKPAPGAVSPPLGEGPVENSGGISIMSFQ